MSNSHFYVAHTHKKVVVWSPKCACSTIVSSFVHKYVPQSCAHKEDPRAAIRRCNMMSDDYGAIPKDYTIDWYMRDPFERTVSCFINKFVASHSQRITDATLEPFARKFLEYAQVGLDQLTFRRFVNTCDKINRERISFSGVHHFLPQVNVDNYALIRAHKGLRVHDIQTALTSEPCINASRYADIVHAKLSDVCVRNIKDDAIHPMCFDGMRGRVRAVFAHDVALFATTQLPEFTPIAAPAPAHPAHVPAPRAATTKPAPRGVPVVAKSFAPKPEQAATATVPKLKPTVASKPERARATSTAPVRAAARAPMRPPKHPSRRNARPT